MNYLIHKETALDDKKYIRIGDTVKSFDIFESPGYKKIKPIQQLLADTPKD